MAERSYILDNQDQESVSSSTSMASEISTKLPTEQPAEAEGSQVQIDMPQNKQIDEPAQGATGLETTIDRLLVKQKNELMCELRRIQHGDRPVTGQGNKEAVEQFFHRALNTDEAPQEAPDANRPEHVVVEVNALVERRPVSSILQSAGFRRNLEHALRGAMINVSRRQPTRLSRTPAERAIPEATRNETNSERAPSTPSSRTASPVPPPRESVRSRLQLRRQEAQSLPTPAPRTRATVPQPPPVPAIDNSNAGNQAENSFAESWLRREEQNNFNAGAPVHVWETIEQAHREEIIADISELVHRQIVTNGLSNNFRHTLENMMMHRLQSSDTDGRRVQDFVRSIPQTHMHVRNDFSELGIHEQLQEQLSDEVSVVSATAAVTVPYVQSNAAMSREMQALKAQLQEMKNMMKLQFDLTMDLQRSVRQEVAAAMNQTQASQQTQPIASSRPVSDTHCLICLDKGVDTVLYQCGHMCVCHGCGMNLMQRGSNCPVCRAPIRDIIRAYKCNSD